MQSIAEICLKDTLIATPKSAGLRMPAGCPPKMASDKSHFLEAIESPSWHKDVLDRRQQRIADGRRPIRGPAAESRSSWYKPQYGRTFVGAALRHTAATGAELTGQSSFSCELSSCRFSLSLVTNPAASHLHRVTEKETEFEARPPTITGQRTCPTRRDMRTWPRALDFRRWLLLLTAASAILGSVEAARTQDHQTRVLVLYSTRRDAQIAMVGDRELPRILEQGMPQGFDYYSEYLDRARFPDPDYHAAFLDFLRLKYKDQQFDLVIAMSDLALRFIDETRSVLFHDTPVVFFSSSPATRRVANSTGVIAELTLSDTVALAAELQPDMRQVFVVSGADPADKEYERQARAQLQSFEPRLTVTYLSGLPTKELESRLATLPPLSIVYFLLVSRDGAGENFHPLRYVDRVTAVASAPTYSWVDSTMNHGIVGGSLKSQEAETAAVGTLALRVLHGEPADSIPLSAPDLRVRQVDWRQLRRWGISEARVPAGTLIQFREPSAWERYKVDIIVAAALLLAQTALIAGLLVQRARRRRTEMMLRASQGELYTTYAQLLGAQEDERFRIARDLHDDIGQRMAVLTWELEGVDEGLRLTRPDLSIRIHELSGRTRELARDIQSISRNLHSSKLHDLGLALALKGFCREVSEQHKLDIEFSFCDIPDDVPENVEVCIFRVLQEAVTNTVRHAGARHVTVTLHDGGDELRLEVIDDGIGFDQDAARKTPGLGLISMKERLRSIGGAMSVESRPSAGTTIRIRAPLHSAGGPSARATK